MIGCPTDSGGNGNNKVVVEKYRGKWVDENDTSIYFILTEKEMSTSLGYTQSVYTEGNILYGENGKIGTFESDTRYKNLEDDVYIKQ
jgi:hypothetical protein